MVGNNIKSIIGTSALILSCASTQNPSFPIPEIELQNSYIKDQEVREKTIYDVCDYSALHKLKLSAEEFNPALPAVYALRESLEHPKQEISGPVFKTEFDALINIIANSLDKYVVLSEKMNKLCPQTTPDNLKECRTLHSQVTGLERDIESSARILSQNYGYCF